MRKHPATAAVVLITLGYISLPAPLSAQARTGIITGVVLDESQQPVARAQVQAFSVGTNAAKVRQDQGVPFSTRASGTASTDAEGRFQITGLEPGEYLIAAETQTSSPSSAPRRGSIYARTFYPSTIDDQAAVPVLAMSYEIAPIRIALVRVEGVRVTGSVVSQSGRPASGMDVRLFRRFGNFGSESTVASVGAEGGFEIPRVPPGWYQLTIVPRQVQSTGDAFLLALANGPSESATMLIEVRDRDIDGLSLEMRAGASISGRVVAEPGVGVLQPVGMRVSASPSADYYGTSMFLTATVGSESTFRMTGLSGSYEFTVSSDRVPLKATRITIDGVAKASAVVELTEGSHEVVVFVGPREPPPLTFDKTLSTAALVEQFKGEAVSYRQLPIAQELVGRRDLSVLSSLMDWLNHEDRHLRGNAAFVFAGLGDFRGFQVIVDMLTDRGYRPEGQGTASPSSDGRYRFERQVAADRYYAVHLLGQLRDPRAIPILVPLLRDKEVDSNVPWALGQIGGRAAVDALLDALDEDSPSMRVSAIYALETLNAKEAVPRLIPLLDDHRRSNLGTPVEVAEAAKAAIAKLR
jgi:HEAT repeat protein/carboxypeptidase family protein